jgi:hypothetical protein
MTSFGIKCIALTTMIIDHAGVLLSYVWDTYYLRVIGRVAFPVYAFLIAEGCRKTRNIRKYLMRLGIFALASEVPFDLFLFGRVYYLESQNIFFTLFLGAAAIWAYNTALKKLPLVVCVFVCIPFAFLAYLMRTDYGAYGVIAIFVCGVFEQRWQQAVALALVMLSLYADLALLAAAALPAAGLILIYNGRRGLPVKLAFYAAYPGHLLLLAAIGYGLLH